VNGLSIGCFIAAYLSAVVDGARQPRGLFPESSGGRFGVRRYAREHPWIIVGALLGVAGTVLAG
jgi:hypothetical protein